MKTARYFWLGCAAVGAWASTMSAFAHGAAVPSDQSVAKDSADEVILIYSCALNEAAQNIQCQAPSLVEAITLEDLRNL